MLEIFESILKAQGLVDPGDRLVLGVSGGPDSMTMLDLFLRIKAQWALDLFVVHVNHGLRGEAAQRDAQSVAAFCDAHGVPFHGFEHDVASLSEMWRMSFEEAGRTVRYEAFESVLDAVGATKIAVAQNRNDQAETVLMRIMRGTGPDGLQGIPEKRGAHIIRPILFMTRAQVEAYCQERRLPICYDHTNEALLYTRNRIRLELLPYMETHFNEQIVDALARLGDLVAQDVDYMATALSDILARDNIDIETQNCLDVHWFNALHPALQSRLIRRIVDTHGAGLKNVGQTQIEGVLELVRGNKHGKQVTIGSICFYVQYGGLYHTPSHKRTSAPPDPQDKTDCFEVQILEKAEFDRTVDRLERPATEAYVDMDAVRGNLFARYRKDGDKFQPLGMKGTKKLKNFLIDLKIPLEQRRNIPLLCDEAGIIWVVGHRLSDRVKLTETTRRVGIIKWSDGC